MSQKTKALSITLAIAILAFGVWVRFSPKFAGALGAGYDERLYVSFLDELHGGASFPKLVENSIRAQSQAPDLRVSPLRTMTLLHGWAWISAFSGSSFDVLMLVSAQASVAAVVVAGLFARRMGGNGAGLAVMAMMAVAPLQIFNAHRSLTDGYFSLWVTLMMWALWECLERPEETRPRWLLALSWIPVLLCKESACFVWLGTLAVLAFVRASDGKRSGWRTWFAVCAGPSVGLAIQVALFGGVRNFLTFLEIFRHKPVSDFAKYHATGPWWAYVLALLLLSQLTTILACGAVLGEPGKERSAQLMIGIIVGTFGPISAFPTLVVPRALALADFGMRWLCWLQVDAMAKRFDSPRWATAFRVALVAVICALDFRQFYLYFQTKGVYEPTNDLLLWCLDIVRQY